MLIGVCELHGEVQHYKRSDRRQLLCKPCVAARVKRRYNEMRALLLAEAGGQCIICGYCHYNGALQFHHIDPSTKSFKVSGGIKSLARLRAEVTKCVLLCGNCHAEVEAGVTGLPT